MKILVAILAGGEGSRIGGNKPLRTLAGETLLGRAARQAEQWSDVVAIAFREPSQAGDMRLTHIFDEAGIEGPLAGLAAALRHADAAGCGAVLTIPSDMPFLPPDLRRRLIDALGPARAAIASSGGYLHPVCGLWRVSALEELAGYLASDKHSLKGFADAIGFNAVEWPNEPIDPFFNINSAQDLADAEYLLRG